MPNTYRIGDASRLLGVSVDTLRYYEKIGLLPMVDRTASGTRVYSDRDISRLRFIQRAQKMNFSLREISGLLNMREDPRHAREDVRALTVRKMAEIEKYLEELQYLRNELQLLLNLCAAAEDGCPIIEAMEGQSDTRSAKGGKSNSP